MKIALTGATGFIGLHLINSLVGEHEVVPLVRPETKIPPSFQSLNLSHRKINFQDVDSISTALFDIDIVIHCAGVIKGLSYSDYKLGNVTYTQNLVQAITSLKNQPYLIHVSSAAACGPSLSITQLKDETYDLTPVSMYGLSKKQAEESILSCESLRFYSIIRPVGVYGPGDNVVLPIFKLAKLRLAFYFGSAKAHMDMIYIDDLVNSIVVLTKLKPFKEIYIASDGNHYTQKNIVSTVFKIMGNKRPFLSLSIPKVVTLFIGHISSLIAKIKGKPFFFNKDKAKEAIQNTWAFDTKKLSSINKMGMSLENGLKETHKYYIDKKLI